MEDPLVSAMELICARAAMVEEEDVGDGQWRPAVKAMKSGDIVWRRHG